MSDAVNNPSHYGGAGNPYEVILVLEAWGLDKDFCLGNSVKYVARAGKKDRAPLIEDLKKARWYLDRKIARLEAEQRDLSRCCVPENNAATMEVIHAGPGAWLWEVPCDVCGAVVGKPCVDLGTNKRIVHRSRMLAAATNVPEQEEKKA